jgi:hypothetical protein
VFLTNEISLEDTYETAATPHKEGFSFVRFKKKMQAESIPEYPTILSSYQPKEPISRIHEQKDIDAFVQTQAFDRIMKFVMLLNSSVLQKKISDPCTISAVKFYTKDLPIRPHSFFC